jgi:hypothetical protein
VENYLVLGFAAIIGMMRGAVSLVFEHPLDVIKTYWQAHPGKSGVISVISEVRRLKGWRGFYSGALPNVMRVMLKQAYRYPLMIVLPVLFAFMTSSVLVISIATGLSIAMIEVWMITPLERFKVWLMTYPRFCGGVRSFIKEVRHNVVHTIYKGVRVTLLRQVISWITFLMTHDQLMVWVKSEVGSAANISLYMLLVVGVVEGTINTVAVLPFDCVKTHQQKKNATKDDRFIAKFKWIYHHYGVRGLYVGWQARMMQYMINSGFTVVALERLREGFVG